MTPEILKANISKGLESLRTIPVGNPELQLVERSVFMAKSWLCDCLIQLSADVTPFTPIDGSEVQIDHAYVNAAQEAISSALSTLKSLRNTNYPHRRNPIQTMFGESAPALFFDDVFIGLQNAINASKEAQFVLDIIALDYPEPVQAPEPEPEANKAEVQAQPEQPQQPEPEKAAEPENPTPPVTPPTPELN